jgi:hypothetical protein
MCIGDRRNMSAGKSRQGTGRNIPNEVPLVSAGSYNDGKIDQLGYMRMFGNIIE